MSKHFFKAQGVNGKEVESQTLVFDKVVPDFQSYEWEGVASQQANQLCDVLLTTLPQGVTDRLLAILMKKRASLSTHAQEGNQ